MLLQMLDAIAFGLNNRSFFGWCGGRQIRRCYRHAWQSIEESRDLAVALDVAPDVSFSSEPGHIHGQPGLA